VSVLPRGRIKDVPEDFVVEELPAYEAQGTGDHLFVRFTKRNLTTEDAVKAIAHGAGVQARDVGVAGLKDKVGVTTQTISLPIPRASEGFEERVMALSLPGIVLHEAKRHANKLKTGHLLGNRFTIVVRGLADDAVDEVVASFERAGRDGIPNAFGSQRFGRDRDNAAQALAWLRGNGRGPSDPRKKRFLWSALQSSLFNEVLERRVADGTWRTPLAGDILKKTDSGGLFDCTEEATDQARALRGEVSPTGPMFGAKMREPSGTPGELERAVFEERLGKDFDLARTKPFGEGTRRGLCLGIQGMRVVRDTIERSMNQEQPNPAPLREQDARLTVCFVLPKGAYATSVLGAAVLFEPDMTNAPTLPADDRVAEPRTERTETESDLE
jgi:tRNA pseudouridine13 synthase